MIIGPQSYHQINSLISNFNKIVTVTEFETEDKFDYLDKIKNTSSKAIIFTVRKDVISFVIFV